MADKAIRMTTPKGVAQYPWLNTPDTKYNAVGEYKVNLVVPAKEAAPFVKKVTAIRDEAFKASKNKKKANLPFEKETDDQGDETGNIIFKCKVKNIQTKKGETWERQPKLFDAHGHRTDVKVGGGSILKLNVEVYPWDIASQGVGVMLQPVAVQVIELVEFGSGESADDFGFEKEEGFVRTPGESIHGVEVSPESEDEDLF